jgi:PadR family transcriptional regulator, regulatory protein PadR
MPMTAANSDQRDLFRGALEMMILQSLRRQPMHGYALVQHIKQRSNDLLQVEEGSLYPALQRMLKDNLVKAQWETSGSEAPFVCRTTFVICDRLEAISFSEPRAS